MIGVFDSGSGGLTIMRAFDEAFPNRSFVYFGDHGNAPYGDRSPEEIYKMTKQGIERLFNYGCALTIVACNTAAAWSLRRLQREWLPYAYPTRRVLGVVVPVIEDLTGIIWDAEQQQLEHSFDAKATTVAIFATHQCVASGAFPNEIRKRAPHMSVWQQECPGLVQLIEAHAPTNILSAAVEGYIKALETRMNGDHPDICILGCTHYPLIESLFRSALPESTVILSQPAVTARSLAAYLDRHLEFRPHELQTRRFITSGEPELASRVASRFYGKSVTFERV